MSWYKDGLRFKCTECGKCCTGTSGYVFVTEDEMSAMAQHLQIPLDLFKRRFTRQRNYQYALTEKRTRNGEYDCVFLEDKKCKVYPARPQQCRTFPWWQENLNSETSWKLASLTCEGINDEAPIVTYETIEKELKSNQC